MAKTLCLLRHAKSSWADPALDDFDRPLNQRGRSSMVPLGLYIGEKKLHPDSILCSSAQRTRETLSLLLPWLRGEAAIRIERSLYLANANELLMRLRRTEDEASCLLMIGHNPGLEDLAGMLAGTGDAFASAAMQEKFPTAALAVLDFDAAHWADVAPDKGELRAFVSPKLLSRA
ncbi:MAG: histidine phosphatase family protein [Alphaproteobacteria bacterium]